jgi:hypothetical protein
MIKQLNSQGALNCHNRQAVQKEHDILEEVVPGTRDADFELSIEMPQAFIIRKNYLTNCCKACEYIH